MAELSFLQPLSNVDSRNDCFFIILCDPIPIDKNLDERSGFSLIRNNSQSQNQPQNLDHFLKFTRKIFTRSKDENSQQNMNSLNRVEVFYDFENCKDRITFLQRNSVCLLLSDSHATRTETISEFRKLRQITIIYRYPCELYQRHWKERCCFQDKFFNVNKLRETLDNRKTSELIEHFLEEILLKRQSLGEARADFLAYCQEIYHDKPKRIRQVELWLDIYHEKTPIYWYTSSGHVAFRIVSRVCCSGDLTAIIRCRFFLCDLYKQLKQLHNEQLEDLKREALVVYRGAYLKRDEFDSLKSVGNLLLTRPFLSTSKEESRAKVFCKDGNDRYPEVAVLLTIEIDSEQIDDSLIANITQHSANQQESEVMLTRRLVFRVDSHELEECEEGNIVHIKLIRGQEEAVIERDLRKNCLAIATASGCPLLSLIAIPITDKYPNVGTSASPKTHAILEPRNPQNNGSENVNVINNQNAISHHAIDIVEQTPQNTNVATAVGSGTNTIATQGAGVTATTGVITTKTVVTVVVPVSIALVVIVAISTGVTLGIIRMPHNDTSDRNTPRMCQTSCVFFPFVDNPSSNYQGQQLNFTCSQTLTNMTLTTIVQRNYNETHAQQYQTFWNQSTNMTYSVTPSQIIYTWFSWFHMYIVANSFPNYVRVEFYYTPGFTRVTSNDTWTMTATTSCGESISHSGTF